MKCIGYEHINVLALDMLLLYLLKPLHTFFLKINKFFVTFILSL